MMDVNFRGRTTPKSLSFNCRQCAGKLAAPIVYNYLGLVYESGAYRNSATSFSKFYALTPLINGFSTFVSCLVVVLVALQCGNCFNRALVKLGLARLQFGDAIVDEHVADEGRQQLRRFRAMMEKDARRQATKEKISKMRRKSYFAEAVSNLTNPHADLAELKRQEPDLKTGWLEKKAPMHGVHGFSVSKGWQVRSPFHERSVSHDSTLHYCS